MKNPFKLLLILTALALPMAGLADEEEYVMTGDVKVDTVSPGTRITVTSEDLFSYGTFWGTGDKSLKVTDSNGTLVFRAGDDTLWGYFTLRSKAAIGDNTLTLKQGSETATCEIYFDEDTIVYVESSAAKVDTVNPGTKIDADGATEFAYASYWANDGSDISVVADSSMKVFSKSGTAYGVFTLPIAHMTEGDHTLVITVKGSTNVSYTCQINLKEDYPYIETSAVNIDTQTPQTTILLQSDDDMAYSLHWGSEDAASVAVLADGLAGTSTEDVTKFQVYDSTETGWLNTFSWDYSETPKETLPRGPYTLSHCTFDGENVLLDTTKCSVKLLPEPMAITGLIWLLALLGSARKRG